MSIETLSAENPADTTDDEPNTEQQLVTDGGRAECEGCMTPLAAHEREVGWCESCATECFVGSDR